MKKSNIAGKNIADESYLTVAASFAPPPPVAGDCAGVLPEFGRIRDVERIFAIKRGLLYRKINDGTIRSISLRERGKKFGCRLIYLASVRQWLYGELAKQNPSPTPELKTISNLAHCDNTDPHSVNNTDRSANRKI